MDTKRAHPQDWPWPDTLDALVAAPGFHQLLYENDRVRVLEVRIAPSQIVPVHTHCWPGVVYVKSSSHFLRRDGQGALVFDSRTTGAPPAVPIVQWLDRLPPHSVENIGSTDIHLISVELKDESA